jgi:large subunit ribosomal protein L25
VNVEVPVRFEGSSPGVKGGGSLIQQIRKVKLKTTPENLIDKVVFDISELELNQAIRIKDAQIGESIQIMNPLAMPVATVEVPRALKSLEAEEEEAAAAAAAAAEDGEGAEGEEAGSEGGKE